MNEQPDLLITSHHVHSVVMAACTLQLASFGHMWGATSSYILTLSGYKQVIMRSQSPRTVMLWSLLILTLLASFVKMPPFQFAEALEIPRYLESPIEAVFGGNSWLLKERRAARREAERRRLRERVACVAVV